MTGPRGAVPATTASFFMNASKQVGATLRRPTPLGGTPAATLRSFTKSSKPTPCKRRVDVSSRQQRSCKRSVARLDLGAGGEAPRDAKPSSGERPATRCQLLPKLLTSAGQLEETARRERSGRRMSARCSARACEGGAEYTRQLGGHGAPAAGRQLRCQLHPVLPPGLEQQRAHVGRHAWRAAHAVLSGFGLHVKHAQRWLIEQLRARG